MIYKIWYRNGLNKNTNHLIKKVDFGRKTAFMKSGFGRKNNRHAGKLAEYSGQKRSCEAAILRMWLRIGSNRVE